MKYQTLGILGVLATISASSASASNVTYFDGGRVEIEEITAFEDIVGADSLSVVNPVRSWRATDTTSSFTSEPTDPFSITDPIGEAEVILDRIIAIGDKIWKIIEKNKPVVGGKYHAISALPSGAGKWEQLENWATPETRVYRMTYKNAYGMTVVDFAFRVAYTYGGSVNGKGKYLANIAIEPRAVDVAWGYKFNANGEVVNVHNAGTRAKPVAGVEIKIDWQINTVFKHSQESNRFFVRGDGLFKNLSDGTLPAL